MGAHAYVMSPMWLMARIYQILAKVAATALQAVSKDSKNIATGVLQQSPAHEKGKAELGASLEVERPHHV
jgi:hypothetical protein